jgi:hypothetical protein
MSKNMVANTENVIMAAATFKPQPVYELSSIVLFRIIFYN